MKRLLFGNIFLQNPVSIDVHTWAHMCLYKCILELTYVCMIILLSENIY